jgi:hypothetical protein
MMGPLCASEPLLQALSPRFESKEIYALRAQCAAIMMCPFRGPQLAEKDKRNAILFQ